MTSLQLAGCSMFVQRRQGTLGRRQWTVVLTVWIESNVDQLQLNNNLKQQQQQQQLQQLQLLKCKNNLLTLLSSPVPSRISGDECVFIWHDRWQCLWPTPISSRSSFSIFCDVLFGLPTLLLPSSGVHSKARLTGLVARSHRMWPTNRLQFFACCFFLL